jgi:hypothetical protein
MKVAKQVKDVLVANGATGRIFTELFIYCHITATMGCYTLTSIEISRINEP